jgi:MoaA/NifB/PqqE/SkfB family radical SAM enzyme
MCLLKSVKCLHLELTHNCNSKCVDCNRTMIYDICFKNTKPAEISIEDSQKMFSEDFVKNLKHLVCYGSFGDFCMAKDALEILQRFHKINDKLQISMCTNGGARSPLWWSELASVRPHISFCIDGLEDTLDVYRRGVKFNRVIENAKAFINSGGIARWVMLLFEHNQHQTEQARKLSEKMGFVEFQIKQAWGSNNDKLRDPSQSSFRNYEGEMLSTKDKPKVSCSPSKINPGCYLNQQIHISADKYITPCCYLALIEFYARNGLFPYNQDVVVFKSMIDLDPERFDSLSLQKHSIEEIIHGKFFQKLLPQNLQIQNTDNGLLLACAKNCGIFEK